MGKFARMALARRTSTTTAGCAWSAPARATRRRSASTAPPIPGPTSSAPSGLDQRRERRRVRADHDQLCLAGPRAAARKIIVVDPRITPIARTCDLFLPVKPGRDIALFNGILHLMIEHDWLDHEFIETTPSASMPSPARRANGRRAHGRSHRHRRAADPAGGRVVGHGEDQLPDARARHRASQPRRAERARRDQHRAGLGTHRPRTAAMPRSPARPTARAAASTARSATSFPAAATSPTRSIAPTSPASGGCDPTDLPQPGVDAYEIFRKIDRGEIRGLLSICFNPAGLAAGQQLRRRMLEKLEFYVASTSSSTRRPAMPTSSCPARCRKRTKARSRQIEGRVIKINKAVDARRRRQDWRIIQDIARALGREHGFTFESRGRSSTNCAARRRAASPTTPASPTRRSSGSYGVFWPVAGRSDDPDPARRGCSSRVLEPDREGRRAVLLSRRQGALQSSTHYAARPKTSMTNIRSS